MDIIARRRGATRRLMALAVATALLAIPGTALADRPTVEEVDRIFLGCFMGDETTFSDAGFFVEEWGADAWFTTGTFVDEETPPEQITTLGSELVAIDDTSATFQLVLGTVEWPDDPNEEPVFTETGDTATLTAAWAPAGPAEPFEQRHKQGNVQVREVGHITPLTGSITVVTEGPSELGTFHFTDCSGEHAELQVWRTSPRAFTLHDNFAFFACDLENEAGDFAHVSVDQWGGGVFAFAYLLPADGEPMFGDTEDARNIRLTKQHASATIPLVGDEGATATATLDAQIATAHREGTTYVFQGGRARETVEILAITGTLTFSTGQTFQITECEGVRVRFSLVERPAGTGPKATGRALPHDDPAGALPLRVGARANLHTVNAALAPEVEASCAPMVHTVWYTITGTGGPVTVDTSGSQFDTAVAVYVQQGGEFVEVACVDDTPTGEFLRSLQAQVTFETEASVTYYVQVGGFDNRPFGAAEAGLLKLRVY